MPLRPRLRRILGGLVRPPFASDTLADPQRRLLVLERFLVTSASSNQGAASLRVVTYGDHAIHAFANRLDVGDENDLLEPIMQSAQQLDDVEPARFVEGAEHLVQNQ